MAATLCRSKSELSMAKLHRKARRAGAARSALGTRADAHGEAEQLAKPDWTPWRWRRRYLALKRFRGIVRSVILAIRWMNFVINRYDSTNNRVAHALKAGDQSEAGNGNWVSRSQSGLVFNAAHYRAKKEVALSPELLQILQQPPQQRSTAAVRALTRCLQSLPTFNEYPLRVQRKLAQVARFHAVPPGRVVIRQGHPGVNFYVIISGRALVHVVHQQRDAIVAALGQGQAFGEVALMQPDVTRTASIVSQEALQLLAIGRDEFQEIFSHGNSSNKSSSDDALTSLSRQQQELQKQLPDHVRHLLSCAFMRQFPPGPLLASPSACRTGCYRRNAVVVADSKACPDLVLLRWGSCRVMKRLRVNRTDGPTNGSCLNGEDKNDSRQLLPVKLPNLLQSSVGPSYAKVDTGLARRRRRQFEFAPLHSKKLLPLHLPPVAVPASSEKAAAPPPAPPAHRAVPALVVTSDEGEVETVAAASVLIGGIDVQNRHRRQRNGADAAAEDDEGKKFVTVQIGVLKPGDVFGLSDILFQDEKIQEVEDSASVSLVSNGTECVLLSKSFFIQHAPEAVKRRVREAAQPYPSETVMEGSYYTRVAWDRYRRAVLSRALNRALLAATG